MYALCSDFNARCHIYRSNLLSFIIINIIMIYFTCCIIPIYIYLIITAVVFSHVISMFDLVGTHVAYYTVESRVANDLARKRTVPAMPPGSTDFLLANDTCTKCLLVWICVYIIKFCGILIM
jgi:hypothetical protein|uniref:Uncharacterized protein n=1 Tax=Sipha flava TaxID=143950 RepID=A0A2S2R8H2_9HEMI